MLIDDQISHSLNSNTLTPFIIVSYPDKENTQDPRLEPWVRIGCRNHTLFPIAIAIDPLQA